MKGKRIMKKKRMIIMVACIMAIGLVFTGCSCSKDSNSTNSTSSQSSSNSSANSSSKDANNTNASDGTNQSKSGDAKATSDNGGSQDAGRSGESKGTGIVGSWKFDDSGASLVFTFNADKTGTYDLMGQKMDFTYNDDGADLNIKFSGDTNVTSTPYTLNGDTLTIKDASGADLVYKRI